MKKTTLVFLTMAGLMPAIIGAQGKTGPSLWAILEREHCLDRIHQVLEDSRLEPGNIRNLPAGTEIDISTCGKAASPEEAELSRQILWADEHGTVFSAPKVRKAPPPAAMHKGEPSSPVLAMPVQAPPLREVTDGRRTAIIGTLCGIGLALVCAFALWDYEPKGHAKSLPVPPAVCTEEHWGNYICFTRRYVPESGRPVPYDECEICHDLISIDPGSRKKHLEEKHEHHGRIVWEVRPNP